MNLNFNINTIYKYTLLLSCISAFEASAIKFNGVDINTLIKPDESLSYTAREIDNNIVIRIQEDNIEVGSAQTFSNIQELNELRKELYDKKDRLPGITSGIANLKAGISMKLDPAYVEGRQEAILNALTINIKRTILKSPFITFSGNLLDIGTCFLDADVLQIEPKDSQLFKVIRFYFDKTITSIPHLIEGQINFEKDEISDYFTVMGARKISIVFKDKAFQNGDE